MKKFILYLSLLLLPVIAARGDVINIVDEGAVPNDGIDDTAAIQQAINVAAASTTTRTVYAPCGTYDVDGQLTITTSGISLIGESPSCVTFDGTGSSSNPLIRIGTIQSTPTRLQVTDNLGGSSMTMSTTVRRGTTTAGTGTVTVTNSSSAFSYSGATLTNGQIIQIGTVQGIVETVNTSNSTGTFTSAWQGTSQTSSFSIATRDLFYPDAGVSVTGVSTVSVTTVTDFAGTIAVTNGSATVTGTGTTFTTDFVVGDRIRASSGYRGTISAIGSNTSMTLSAGWGGPTKAATPYARVRTTTYAAGTDYTVGGSAATYTTTTVAAGVNNFLSWAPGGSEPAAGDIYDVTFTYIPAGDRTATLASTTGLAAGDVVVISSDLEMFDWSRPSYQKGEVAEIASISGSVVTFKQPLRDAYLANTTWLIEPTLVSDVVLRGFRLLRSNASTTTAIDAYWPSNLLVEQLRVEKASQRGITVFGGIDITIRTTEVLDTYPSNGVGTGNNYGIFLGSVSRATVSDCRVDGGRHAVDVSQTSYSNGTTAVNWGVSRDVVIRDNFIGSSAGAEMAFHTHLADNAVITANTLREGAALTVCRACVLTDNDITAAGQFGIDLDGGTFVERMVVENNRVSLSYNNAGVPGAGILYRHNDSPTNHTARQLIIRGNELASGAASNTPVLVGLATSQPVAPHYGEIVVADNVYTAAPLASGTPFIYVALVEALEIGAIDVHGNTGAGAIRVDAMRCRRQDISRNTVNRTPGDGYTLVGIRAGSTNVPAFYEGLLHISGNAVRGFDAPGIWALSRTATELVITDNLLDSNGASEYQLRVNATASTPTRVQLVAANNIFKNTLAQSTAGCVRVLASGTAVTEVAGRVHDNLFDGCATATLSSVTAPGVVSVVFADNNAP